jgi:hypothetical protein
MPFDYSEAPPPRDTELIPKDTVASVQMQIRPGNAGEGGLLKRSAKGDCELLAIEFALKDGAYARRRFWENWVVSGTTQGHSEAAGYTRSKLRAMLESARGIQPSDLSEQARAARTVDLKDFDGMVFIGKIGVERGKPRSDGSGENYPDKNVLAAVITPDKRDWHPNDQPQQPPPWNGGGGRAAPAVAAASAGSVPAPINRPAWAKDSNSK